MNQAIFAAGCFWGVEAAFRRIQGVTETVVGYTGGILPSPTYEQVCSGTTGHAEAVKVTYDPVQVSYEQLLDTFWSIHDPTTPNRQGPDVGHQYRSAIFFSDKDQERAAIRSKEEHQKDVHGKIVTEILPAGEFHPAEDYHQRYLEKRGLANCHI